MPTRAHESDAGLDLYSTTHYTLLPGESCTIDTGVHIEIPPGYVGLVKSRSGLHTRHGMVTDSVIDSGFTGSIHVRLDRLGRSRCQYDIRPGDRIAQLVIVPCVLPDLIVVDKLQQSDRGNDGFGSSGR